MKDEDAETEVDGAELSREEFEKRIEPLRAELLAAQTRLGGSGMAIVILVSGPDGAGKTAVARRLLEWIDARGVEVHALRADDPAEEGWPEMQRFWRRIPAKGRLAIFINGWYESLFEGEDGAKGRSFRKSVARARAFESLLEHDEVGVIKIRLELSQEQQKAHFEDLESDPDLAWQVTKRDWKQNRKFDRYDRIAARVLKASDSEASPWHRIPAADGRERDLRVAELVLDQIRGRLDRLEVRPPRVARPDLPATEAGGRLADLDFRIRLSDTAYEKRIERATARLLRLTHEMHEEGRTGLVVAFEGPDAAGKGGAIRRLAQGLDPRDYRVVSVAAPTEEERAHPWLWRFWRHAPRRGRITIFDRTWYGRVLVERVEGFCEPEDWRRAFDEIRNFEGELCESGLLLQKFWIQVSPEEQLRRFLERRMTPYKQYKLGEDDWRNRSKREAYDACAEEAFRRTDAPGARWKIVAGDDKRAARVAILEHLVRRLERMR